MNSVLDNYGGINFRIDGDKLRFFAPPGVLTEELRASIKLNKESIVAALSRSLSYWIEQVRATDSIQDVLTLADQFRPLDWTDKERSEFSKAYIGRIELLQIIIGGDF